LSPKWKGKIGFSDKGHQVLGGFLQRVSPANEMDVLALLTT
jgi:hypothetical protein